MTLSVEHSTRYLALRRARRIGMLWYQGGEIGHLAPLGVDRRDCAAPITTIALMRMVQKLEEEDLAACPRKPVQSAVTAIRKEDVCAA